MIPKLTVISTRAGIDEHTGALAWAAAAPQPEQGPWAKLVNVPCTSPFVTNTSQCVVGQGKDSRFFTVFPCPFFGHREDWQVILPIHSAEDLLKQLG